MNTFTRSWALTKESLAVLRRTPALMAFPVISFLLTVMVSISFVAPYYLITGFNSQKTRPEIWYPVTFLFYLVTYTVVIFFNSAMVACAYESLNGRPTSFSYGLSVASKRIGAILGWAAISATVGMILRTISERTGIIGNIVVGLIGFVWNVATYFVVPLIVIEHGGPVVAVKKSTEMLKQTWGERLIVAGGANLAMGLLAILGVFGIVGGAVLASVGPSVIPGILLACSAGVYLLVVAIVAASLQGIFQTAVYMYASTGMVPEGFSPDAVQNAFKIKRPRD